MLDYQNTTWQGTVTFLDTNQKIPFRSVLELIKLMDSAIGSSDFSSDVGVGFASASDSEVEEPVSAS